MKLKMLAAASMVAMGVTGAQAATLVDTFGGAHDSFETAVETGFSGFKAYDFSLTGTFDVTTTFAAFGAVGSVGLYNSVGDTLVWSWGVGGPSYANSDTFSLSTGSYYYLVGSARPSSFTLTSTAVAAVPEPETYALLAAGLGIVGFVASRRRRND